MPYPPPQSPESPVRVQISDQIYLDGIAVRMAMRHSPENIRIMRFKERGVPHFEEIDPAVDGGATFQIPHEFGRALLEALLRYYQGSGDYHTLRTDYLDERKRVDKMLGTFTTILERIGDQ